MEKVLFSHQIATGHYATLSSGDSMIYLEGGKIAVDMEEGIVLDDDQLPEGVELSSLIDECRRVKETVVSTLHLSGKRKA